MGEIDEAELISAFRAGKVAGDAAGDVAGTGAGVAGGGGRRVVPAALVRRCCHELKDAIDPQGVRLAGAVIAGALDLAALAIPFPVSFADCEFDTVPTVEGADLFGLALTGCTLPGLLGNGVRIRRDLDLSRSRVTGAHRTSASTSQTSAVWLCESAIGGRLLCVDTVIDGLGGRAMQADRMQVGGSIRLLRQFTARGTVRLIGARIDASLDMAGAHIESATGMALELAEAAIGGTVFLMSDQTGRSPLIGGRIDMERAQISGQLLIRDAVLEDRGGAADDLGYPRSTAHGCAVSAPRLSVGAEVTLAGRCRVTGSIDLSMSELSGITVGEQCVLRAPGQSALKLINADLRGDLKVHPGAQVAGTIRLAGAVIHGMLSLNGTLTHPERRSVVGATALVVDGDVDLAGLRTAGGRVNFRSATLGSLAADGAQLENPGGYSLSLNQAHVKGSVRLVGGFRSEGLVVLSRSTIEGRLQCTGGRFSCPGPADRNVSGHAIEAISATVRGGIYLDWAGVWPSVDFTDATTTFLADDPATWPPRFAISGFSYERFERPPTAPLAPVWDQAARCTWLDRQGAFDSGPYEQAARVFRQHGYTSEAEEILMARRRRARPVGRSGHGRLRRAADRVYSVTVGYGYRPWRVLWALAALLVLVMISLAVPGSQATLRASDGNGDVYTTGGLLRAGATPAAASAASGRGPAAAGRGPAAADACGDGEVRCFSPILYAVDTVIPLISLDQRSTWYPDPDVPGGALMLWWLNAATIFGWLLSSIFALSLARLSRSA
jgi:hypothetical protein